jgi:hypothetical protein
VWNHASNAALSKERKTPDILAEGDVLQLPDKRAGGMTCKVNRSYTFVLHRNMIWIKLFVLDEGRRPVAGEAYKLTVGGQAYRGRTDSQGLVEQRVHAVHQQARLEIAGRSLSLRVGWLDPVDTPAGQQQRLENLGYVPAPRGGGDDNGQPPCYWSRYAVEEFQAEHDLKVDGVLGPRTREKLEKIYGC